MAYSVIMKRHPKCILPWLYLSKVKNVVDVVAGITGAVLFWMKYSFRLIILEFLAVQIITTLPSLYVCHVASIYYNDLCEVKNRGQSYSAVHEQCPLSLALRRRAARSIDGIPTARRCIDNRPIINSFSTLADFVPPRWDSLDVPELISLRTLSSIEDEDSNDIEAEQLNLEDLDNPNLTPAEKSRRLLGLYEAQVDAVPLQVHRATGMQEVVGESEELSSRVATANLRATAAATGVGPSADPTQNDNFSRSRSSCSEYSDNCTCTRQTTRSPQNHETTASVGGRIVNWPSDQRIEMESHDKNLHYSNNEDSSARFHDDWRRSVHPAMNGNAHRWANLSRISFVSVINQTLGKEFELCRLRNDLRVILHHFTAENAESAKGILKVVSNQNFVEHENRDADIRIDSSEAETDKITNENSSVIRDPHSSWIKAGAGSPNLHLPRLRNFEVCITSNEWFRKNRTNGLHLNGSEYRTNLQASGTLYSNKESVVTDEDEVTEDGSNPKTTIAPSVPETNQGIDPLEEIRNRYKADMPRLDVNSMLLRLNSENSQQLRLKDQKATSTSERSNDISLTNPKRTSVYGLGRGPKAMKSDYAHPSFGETLACGTPHQTVYGTSHVKESSQHLFKTVPISNNGRKGLCSEASKCNWKDSLGPQSSRNLRASCIEQPRNRHNCKSSQVENGTDGSSSSREGRKSPALKGTLKPQKQKECRIKRSEEQELRPPREKLAEREGTKDRGTEKGRPKRPLLKREAKEIQVLKAYNEKTLLKYKKQMDLGLSTGRLHPTSNKSYCCEKKPSTVQHHIGSCKLSAEMQSVLRNKQDSSGLSASKLNSSDQRLISNIAGKYPKSTRPKPSGTLQISQDTCLNIPVCKTKPSAVSKSKMNVDCLDVENILHSYDSDQLKAELTRIKGMKKIDSDTAISKSRKEMSDEPNGRMWRKSSTERNLWKYWDVYYLNEATQRASESRDAPRSSSLKDGVTIISSEIEPLTRIVEVWTSTRDTTEFFWNSGKADDVQSVVRRAIRDIDWTLSSLCYDEIDEDEARFQASSSVGKTKRLEKTAEQDLKTNKDTESILRCAYSFSDNTERGFHMEFTDDDYYPLYNVVSVALHQVVRVAALRENNDEFSSQPSTEIEVPEFDYPLAASTTRAFLTHQTCTKDPEILSQKSPTAESLPTAIAGNTDSDGNIDVDVTNDAQQMHEDGSVVVRPPESSLAGPKLNERAKVGLADSLLMDITDFSSYFFGHLSTTKTSAVSDISSIEDSTIRINATAKTESVPTPLQDIVYSHFSQYPVATPQFQFGVLEHLAANHANELSDVDATSLRRNTATLNFGELETSASENVSSGMTTFNGGSSIASEVSYIDGSSGYAKDSPRRPEEQLVTRRNGNPDLQLSVNPKLLKANDANSPQLNTREEALIVHYSDDSSAMSQPTRPDTELPQDDSFHEPEPTTSSEPEMDGHAEQYQLPIISNGEAPMEGTSSSEKGVQTEITKEAIQMSSSFTLLDAIVKQISVVERIFHDMKTTLAGLRRQGKKHDSGTQEKITSLTNLRTSIEAELGKLQAYIRSISRCMIASDNSRNDANVSLRQGLTHSARLATVSENLNRVQNGNHDTKRFKTSTSHPRSFTRNYIAASTRYSARCQDAKKTPKNKRETSVQKASDRPVRRVSKPAENVEDTRDFFSARPVSQRGRGLSSGYLMDSDSEGNFIFSRSPTPMSSNSLASPTLSFRNEFFNVDLEPLQLTTDSSSRQNITQMLDMIHAMKQDQQNFSLEEQNTGIVTQAMEAHVRNALNIMILLMQQCVVIDSMMNYFHATSVNLSSIDNDKTKLASSTGSVPTDGTTETTDTPDQEPPIEDLIRSTDAMPRVLPTSEVESGPKSFTIETKALEKSGSSMKCFTDVISAKRVVANESVPSSRTTEKTVEVTSTVEHGASEDEIIAVGDENFKKMNSVIAKSEEGVASLSVRTTEIRSNPTQTSSQADMIPVVLNSGSTSIRSVDDGNLASSMDEPTQDPSSFASYDSFASSFSPKTSETSDNRLQSLSNDSYMEEFSQQT